jgi:hypothetical protein
MHDRMTAGRKRPTHTQLLQRARHYQELARRHHDEERYWLSRALYFGRQSHNSR